MTVDALLEEAERLDEVTERLHDEGRLVDALPLAQRVLELRERVLGQHNLQVAMSCNNLGLIHAGLGNHASAEQLLLRALGIREELAGPGSMEVATTLNNLAAVHRDRGEYDGAKPLLLRALKSVESTLSRVQELVATITDNLGQVYERQGAYTEAEPLHLRAIQLFQLACGATSTEVAASWNNLGTVQLALARHTDAGASFNRAHEIYQSTLEPQHRDVALALNNIATLYQELARYREAEPLLLRALEIRRNVYGVAHRDIAQSLNNLGLLYHRQGAYAQAEKLYEQAREMFEQTSGPTSGEVATCLSNLAMLRFERGGVASAVPLMLRALEISERILGPRHPGLATSLINLGALYQSQADYRRAEHHFGRALDLTEQHIGRQHPTAAISLTYIADLHEQTAGYSRAERLLVRALEIAQQAFGDHHPAVVNPLNHLAALYRVQGAYSKAEPLAQRALEIVEHALGLLHPDLAPSLHNLSEVRRARGDYVQAETFATRALAVVEQALGRTHMAVATSLNNLALVHLSKREYAKAEPLLVRALEIDECTLGAAHPGLAPALQNLAALHRALGAYDTAEPLLRRVLAIREQALTPMHPLLADTLTGLSMLCHVRRDHAMAVSLAARAAEIREHQLRIELASLSETRKRALMALLQGETQGLVSLHADSTPDERSALELAATTVLRRKGRIVDSLVDNQFAVRAHLSPERRDHFDQLVAARAALAQCYTALGPRTVPDPGQIATLRARIDELETDLFADSALLRAQVEPATIGAIQATLPPDAALIELFKCRRFDAQHPPPHWQEERYIAYLVTASGPIQWIELGTGLEIDTRVDAALASLRISVATDVSRAALRQLDAAVLAPVRNRLAGVTHLILAPDGRLNEVPFEALVDPDGRYTIERYRVSYVTTGRDLLQLAATPPPRSPATIFADPDYGVPMTGARPMFAPLPGAAGEAADLQRYFVGPAVTGAQATKLAVIGLAGPAVLHIATHGFYTRPREGSTSHAATRQPVPASYRDIDAGFGDARLMAGIDDATDALERAGLALVGANTGADGILTAREIAHLDWAGTQLVVLSACETGIGAVQAGDGVYGLRRALVLAGAASQVVSLWCVGDSSTRALMHDYYAGLARGDGRAEALRQAQLKMLRSPSEPTFAHPFHWAAFIPAGDWRPLSPNPLLHSPHLMPEQV